MDGRRSKWPAKMAVGQNPVPLVNINIGGKWMFIHSKMEPEVLPHGKMRFPFSLVSPYNPSGLPKDSAT